MGVKVKVDFKVINQGIGEWLEDNLSKQSDEDRWRIVVDPTNFDDNLFTLEFRDGKDAIFFSLIWT